MFSIQSLEYGKGLLCPINYEKLKKSPSKSHEAVPLTEFRPKAQVIRLESILDVDRYAEMYSEHTKALVLNLIINFQFLFRIFSESKSFYAAPAQG
jgi:hypothetical protein